MQYHNFPNYNTTEEIIQVTVYGRTLNLIRRNGRFVKPIELKELEGNGTGMKPSHEVWWLARAPLSESTVAANVLKHGTGALNIDASRVSYVSEKDGQPKDYSNSKGIGTYQESCKEQGARKYADGFSYLKNNFVAQTPANGRWPANLLFSHTLFCTEEQCTEDCPIVLLDKQSGVRKSVRSLRGGVKLTGTTYSPRFKQEISEYECGYNDQGGASRFFQQFYYCPKASQSERESGCEHLSEHNGFDKNTSKQIAHINHETGNTTYSEYSPSVRKNNHPTVKPVNLLKYLIRMITPPGGTVLDMFAGSGSTGLAAIQDGCTFILIEKEIEYVEIARARIAAIQNG